MIRMAIRSTLILISLFIFLISSNTATADTCKAENTDAEYRLVFEDNFDGNSLNRNKWDTSFLWGPGVIINKEKQYYVPVDRFGYSPFKVGNGQLSIEAIKTPFRRDQLYLTRSIYSATSAELLWRVPANGAKYEVYRDGALRATVTGGSYFDPEMRDGIDYAYEVVALDSNGNRLLAQQLTINTADRSRRSPRSPFSLELQARVYSKKSAELTWKRPNRAVRYEVTRNGQMYRSLVGKGYQSLYETNLDSNTNYTYRVESFDVCGESIIAGEVSLRTGDGVTPQPPSAKRLVINVNEYSKKSAEISWNAVENAATYDIYQNDSFVENTAGRSFFMNDLVEGIDRRFRVVVLDANGNKIDETTRVINTADNSFARNRQPFLSGIITSYSSFRFRYGRVEMRARMPAGKGLWSAFWLLNAYYKQDQPSDPEIDIMEAIGDKTNVANQAYHYFEDDDGDGFYTNGRSIENRTFINDFSADYHVYRLDWSKGKIIWYIDGIEVHRVEGDKVSDEQMYVIANLAVGGNFPGPTDETTPFPARYEIDYIRVYQR